MKDILWKSIVTLILIIAFPIVCIIIFIYGGYKALFTPNQTTLWQMIRFIWKAEK